MTNGWIWIDFENTPHVLFLEPIIRRLGAAGWEVRVTAKPQSQTLALARMRGVVVEPIGAGDLVGRTRKMVGGLTRAARLAALVGLRRKPRLLICSSRTAALAAYMLRIPVVGLLDYEHSEHRPLALASRSLWLPDVLRVVDLPPTTRRVARFYPGLKENLYLDSWVFDRRAEREALGVDDRTRLVAARPPATTAHYASARSFPLWLTAVRRVARQSGVRVLLTPRTERQRQQLASEFEGSPSVEVMARVIAGPGIVAAADLLLGGGGTMNREAAVLGVPVWSLFTGPTPYIDQQLAREGRLRWVRTEHELEAALRDPLPARMPGRGPFPGGLAAILADVAALLEAGTGVPT